MDWVDTDNGFCSDFWMSPGLLRRQNLSFDVFHIQNAITNSLMTYRQNMYFVKVFIKEKDI